MAASEIIITVQGETEEIPARVCGSDQRLPGGVVRAGQRHLAQAGRDRATVRLYELTTEENEIVESGGERKRTSAGSASEFDALTIDR